MRALFVKQADFIVTMDDNDRELTGCSILIEGKRIKSIGPNIDPPEGALVIDGRNMWVFPGLVNTHHHLYQTLTRVLPSCQGAELFAWLKYLYPIWAGLTPEAVYTGAMVGLGELLKSGCTTSTDHHYVFPRGQSHLIDAEINAAEELGIRFHPSRGSMSRGEKQGGLPPDSVVQEETAIIQDSIRLIKEYHDASRYSMCRLTLAPCSPFSVTPSLMEESASLAREYGVRLHTHLAETKDEDQYCQQMLGMRPLEFMEKTGWLGEDVWFAHGIHFRHDELQVLARTKTGVAHCPVSNMKLSSGIARIPEMLDLGVPVGLAVDGSASNDGSNMIGEMKAALLLHKLFSGIQSISARQVLSMATRGGATLLGRSDIGHLAPDMAADLFMVNKNRLGFAGCADPVGALVACGDNLSADIVVVNGRIVVKEGRLVNVEEEKIAREGHRLAQELAGKGR